MLMKHISIEVNKRRNENVRDGGCNALPSCIESYVVALSFVRGFEQIYVHTLVSR